MNNLKTLLFCPWPGSSAKLRRLAASLLAAGVASAASAETPYLLSDGTCGLDVGYRLKGGSSKVELTFSLPSVSGQAQKWLMDTGFGEKVLKSYWYLTGSGDAKFLCGRTEEPSVARSFNGQTYTSPYPGKIVTVVTDLENSIHSVRTPRIPDTIHTFAESKAKFGGRGEAVVSGAVSSKPLCVFGRFADAACKTFKDVPKAKLYGLKIYEDGIIVHKFVPCRVRGVACLKDVVGGGVVAPPKPGAFTIHGDAETLPAEKPAAYDIKYPKNPKPWEITAVNELKEYLARRTAGGCVTVGGESSVTFHVGNTPFAAAKGMSSATMKEEEWKIRSFGRDVVLNGGGFRGCLYAVYHFLEDFCGVRWWSEEEEDVPGPDNLVLPKLNVAGKPYFQHRAIFRDIFADISSPEHAARRRINMNGYVKIPVELGGEMGYGPPWFGHTFERYIPWEKYGKDHPEYFAIHKGKRTDSAATQQLCISHPDVKRLLLEGLLANIEKSKAEAQAAGVPRPLLFDFTFNDNFNCCECPKCAAEAEKYGQTGLYLNFVNSVAAQVAKKDPEVFLTACAYNYTIDPPKGGVRAASNVMVKLCSLDANFAGAFDEPGKNASIRDRLIKWRNSAEKLAIWDYAITYGMDTMGYPLPNEWYFGDKYRLFADSKSCSIQWEQEWTRASDMLDLKYYFFSKLNEDPYLDYPALMKTAFSEYFGPKAGPLVFAARARLRDAQLRKKAFVGWMPSMRRFDYIEECDTKYMTELFDKAEALAAGDVARVRRIRKVRRGLDMLVERREKLVFSGELDGKKCWFSDPEVYGRPHRIRAKLVKDAAAPTGKALEMEKRPGYVPPVRAQYYDMETDKILFKRKLVIPEGASEYVWYDLGLITVAGRGVVLMGSDNLVQFYTPAKDFVGKTFNFKVYAALSEKGAVRIGRLAFVETQDK